MKNLFEIVKKYGRKVNKYGLTVIIFVVITFFIGDSTVLDQISYNQQIKQLEKEIEYYNKEKESNLEKLNAIQSDENGLEKFAREQYNMTKSDEELFLIVE
jgi:cell division protein FtsB